MSDTIKNFVDAKKIYLEYISDLIVPNVYKIMMDIYQGAKKETQSDQIMMNFQLRVRNIPDYNQDKVQNLYDDFVFKSKCDWFDELIQIVFITHTAILTSIVNSKSKIDIDVPTSPRFFFRVLIEVARKIYENPYLFKENISPIEILQNRSNVYEIIRGAINKTVRSLLPMKNIVRFCLNYRSIADDDLDIEDGYQSDESYKDKSDINLTTGGGMHKLNEKKSDELIKSISGHEEESDNEEEKDEEEKDEEEKNEDEDEEQKDYKKSEEEKDDKKSEEVSGGSKDMENDIGMSPLEEVVEISSNRAESEQDPNEDIKEEIEEIEKSKLDKISNEAIEEDVKSEHEETENVVSGREIDENSEEEQESDNEDNGNSVDLKGISINEFVKNKLKKISSIEDLENASDEDIFEGKEETKKRRKKKPVAMADFSIPDELDNIKNVKSNYESENEEALPEEEDDVSSNRKFKIIK